MNVYAPVSVASDGISQMYQGVCLLSMAISTVVIQGDSCESALHQGTCKCCGIHVIHAGW